jgi:hypothetical protein
MRRIALVAPFSTALLLALSHRLVAEDQVGAEQASMGWPEVISNLTTERTQAETCVGLIKSRGDAASIDSAKATYFMAKADMDGVIAGLETVLGERGEPGNLPAVRTRVESSAKGLKKICDAAVATATPGTKSIWDEIAKGVAEGAVEPVVDKISDGIAAVWTRYVAGADMTKKAKLEAARWPEFSDIAKK